MYSPCIAFDNNGLGRTIRLGTAHRSKFIKGIEYFYRLVYIYRYYCRMMIIGRSPSTRSKPRSTHSVKAGDEWWKEICTFDNICIKLRPNIEYPRGVDKRVASYLMDKY